MMIGDNPGIKEPSKTKRILRIVLFGAVFLSPGLWSSAARAQDLEPRTFSPAPVGLNIVVLGYGHSEGNVFFDKALPIEDATGVVHSAAGAYVRTFGILGKLAKVSALVPFAWGDWEGLVDGNPATTSRRGFADPRFGISIGLVGSPAVTLKDFVAYKEGIIVGAGLMVVAPLGQYDPTKLINLGSNRWAFRPRLGFSGRLGRWTLETMADVYLFTKNPEAFGGTYVTQKPLWSLQANVIYQFRRGFWGGIGAGLADGGRVEVSGVEKEKIEQNTRFGAVLVFPFSQRASARVFYTNSIRTKLGADFDVLAVDFQYRWGGGI
jgi:hypothetical protein